MNTMALIFIPEPLQMAGKRPAPWQSSESPYALFRWTSRKVNSGRRSICAIMIYLAEKAGRLLPAGFKARSLVIQWLTFQMGSVGPMQGQANVFFRYFPEYLPAAIARYQNEVRRLYGVLDRRFADNEWLATDFSIADIANWCWCGIHNWAGVAIDDLPNLKRWMATIAQRPGCAKGVQLPHETNYNDLDTSQAGAFVKDVQSILVR